MIKTITILLLLCLISGCMFGVDSMPWYDDYKRIAATPHVIDVYDCSDKAGDLAFVWKGCVVVLEQDELKQHAVVWIKPYLIDPSNRNPDTAILFCHSMESIQRICKESGWGDATTISIRGYGQ